jgi:hypothetical protein
VRIGKVQIRNSHSSGGGQCRAVNKQRLGRCGSPPPINWRGVPTANQNPCQCSVAAATHSNLFRSSIREHFPRGKSGCRAPRRVVALEILAGVMAAVGLESTPLTLSKQIPVSRPKCLLHLEASPCLGREPGSRKTTGAGNAKGGLREISFRAIPLSSSAGSCSSARRLQAPPSSKSRRHDALNTKQARHMPARGLDNLG